MTVDKKPAAKKSSSKWWLWLIIACIVVAGVWYFVGRGKVETEAENKGFDADDVDDGANKD